MKVPSGEVEGAQFAEVEVFETHYFYLALLTNYSVWMRIGRVVWVTVAFD